MFKIKNTLSCLLAILVFPFCTQAEAGSATWNLNPTDNLWNTPDNWTPATVPNGETDVATLDASNVTYVVLGESADLDGVENMVSAIVFTPDANAYVLHSAAGNLPDYYFNIVEFYGAGIVNNSGKVQNLRVGAAAGPEEQQSGVIYFQNSSSSGDNVIITNEGSSSSKGFGAYGGVTYFGFRFTDTPSAGRATLINEGGKVSGTIYGGQTNLLDYSTAEAATFINQPGVVARAAAGHTFVDTGGNIGNSTFINNAATVPGAEGGWTEIDIGICEGANFIAKGATSAGPQGGQVYTYGGGGYATFTAGGGQGAGALGGLIEIHNMPDSAQTIVTAEGGSNGGLGGMIQIQDIPSTLDQVQFQLEGNGTLDLSGLLQNPAAIGSLSGQGTVSLGGFILNVGTNNLSTTFSGTIEGSGTVGKAGSGTLTLSGANTYSGSTSVTGGTLIIANQTGSGTGTGAVKVKAGTLGGSGIIAGPVTVGTGSGSNAFLAPAAGKGKPSTLTIQKNLTFETDATYICTFQGKKNKAQSDQVLAQKVTIKSSAVFHLTGQATGRLKRGLTMTLINNTGPNPIGGSFANLPDGAILTVSGNHLQADYTGGDGNDLTLTIVP